MVQTQYCGLDNMKNRFLICVETTNSWMLCESESVPLPEHCIQELVSLIYSFTRQRSWCREKTLEWRKPGHKSLTVSPSRDFWITPNICFLICFHVFQKWKRFWEPVYLVVLTEVNCLPLGFSVCMGWVYISFVNHS